MRRMAAEANRQRTRTAGNFLAGVGRPIAEVDAAIGPGKRVFDCATLLDNGEHIAVYRHGSSSTSKNRSMVGASIPS